MTGGAEKQTEEKTVRSYRVSMDRDRLAAYLMPGPGDEPPPLDDLQALLEESGVVYGVSEEAVKRSLAYQEGEKCQVAWGEAPVPGEDGKLEHLVSLEIHDGPRVLENGRVDYLTRDSIVNVREGQKLLRIIPPTDGTPGRGVDGKEIKPRPGKPARIFRGKGTIASEDESLVLADTNGELVVTPSGRISVVPVHRVSGDVDLSTGHVDFVGSLEIGGSVRDGLMVKADGDIRVGAGVEGAQVRSTGNIVIKGGVKGRGRADISAGGNVQLRFMENAAVHAEGDVQVGEAVMHSTVTAGRSIAVSGKRGLIVGGHLKAGRSISGRVAGAGLGTSTILEIGLPQEVQAEYTELKREKEEKTASLEKVREAENRLRLTGAGRGDEMFDRLKMAQEGLTERLAEIAQRLDYLEEMKAQIKSGRVWLSDTAHSGVRVIIGESQYLVRERLKAPKFGLDSEGEIRILGYGEGD